MASFQKNLFYNIVRLCRIKRKKNKFLQTSFLQKVKHILRERRLHYRRKVNVVVTLGTWVLASELCHRRRSSLTHITCRNSRHEEPGKLKKAKKKKTSRRESFVRAPEQIYFLSDCDFVRRCSRSCAQFSAEMQLQYRFAPARRPRSKRARVFIDDTFRPERFQLSLFWQVSLRLASSHSSLSPDHQSG